ncbi:hypothetical protein THAOC_27956, partial [Thalassiosira oceanica]
MHIKQTPHGEDTEGEESKVPSLSPAIPVPRVPPDPSRSKTERQHPASFDHKHGTPLEVRGSLWSTSLRYSLPTQDNKGYATSQVKIPAPSPTIATTRGPPDPSMTNNETSTPSSTKRHYKPRKVNDVGQEAGVNQIRREERKGIGDFTTVMRVNPTPLPLKTHLVMLECLRVDVSLSVNEPDEMVLLDPDVDSLGTNLREKETREPSDDVYGPGDNAWEIVEKMLEARKASTSSSKRGRDEDGPHSGEDKEGDGEDEELRTAATPLGRYPPIGGEPNLRLVLSNNPQPSSPTPIHQPYMYHSQHNDFSMMESSTRRERKYALHNQALLGANGHGIEISRTKEPLAFHSPLSVFNCLNFSIIPSHLDPPDQRGRTRPIFVTRRSEGIGGSLIDTFVLELDKRLGISEGQFKTHLDGSYYVYVPICNYEVTPRKILDTRGKVAQSLPMVDLNVVITAQGGRNLRVRIEPTATVWDLKEEISRLTGIATTGGAGRKKPPESQHNSASRGTRSLTSRGEPRTKKRARTIQSSRRAAKFRANILRSKLSHEDTLEVMDRRENPNEEVLEREVDDLVESMETDPTSARAFAAQEKFRQTLAKKNVPRYGTLDPQHKQDESIRLMSLNINGLSMSKSVNPKANRLKQIIPKYSLDMVGMQETCINWASSSLRILSHHCSEQLTTRC